MTFVSTLWRMAGSPPPNWQGKSKAAVKVPEAREGICALTGEFTMVWPLAKITTTFTAVDRFRWRLADPSGVALGPAGAWAVRHRLAMQQPHGTINGKFDVLQPCQMFSALISLGQGWVGVPQSRQKHLLPWAQAGTVRTDNETLRWRPSDVERLHTYNLLRKAGFGETALTERTPRFAILSKTDNPTEMLTLWPSLDQWRQHPAYMDVAARATRTNKDQNEQTPNSTDD